MPGDQTRAPWQLRLYVWGVSLTSERALANTRQICRDHLPADGYTLEVIDLAAAPASGEADQILATPTLVRVAPGPTQKLIGDMSDTARVLDVLGLGPGS